MTYHIKYILWIAKSQGVILVLRSSHFVFRDQKEKMQLYILNLKYLYCNLF